jgi:hypothetical protein
MVYLVLLYVFFFFFSYIVPLLNKPYNLPLLLTFACRHCLSTKLIPFSSDERENALSSSGLIEGIERISKAIFDSTG